MEESILLATDLDRTLLPNGPAPESAQARPLFRRFTALPEVILAYVTGRHRALVEKAIADYELPMPDYVIGDVGTSLYAIRAGDWVPDLEWTRSIKADWAGRTHAELAAVLTNVPELYLQETSKQAECKLSFYAPALDDATWLLARVRELLDATGARCRLVWSLDETTDTGLLDVLPSSASKLHALEHLCRRLDIPPARTVYAGDSGNDMEVLVSPIPSVLVANALPAVRLDAVEAAVAAGHGPELYLASGGLADMNGNYAAGILEGVAHFIPATRDWLES